MIEAETGIISWSPPCLAHPRLKIPLLQKWPRTNLLRCFARTGNYMPILATHVQDHDSCAYCWAHSILSRIVIPPCKHAPQLKNRSPRWLYSLQASILPAGLPRKDITLRLGWYRAASGGGWLRLVPASPSLATSPCFVSTVAIPETEA